MKKLTAILIGMLVLVCSTSKAEPRYVLVQSELNVRGRPSLGSEIHGRLFNGEQVEVARKYRDWCFLEGLYSEEGCGWVFGSYLVADPVVQYDAMPATVVANGRVAVRESVEGKRTQWVHPGDTVFVYGMSAEWSVTNRGYIKTEYLAIDHAEEEIK